MRLNRITAQPGDPVEEHYVVEEITADDIAPATKHFLKYVRDLRGFSFVNFLTMDEFTRQARNRFVSRKV